MLKKFLGKEKGAITLFLLLAMLFFLIVLFSLFISTGNKSLSQTSEVDKIKDEWYNGNKEFNFVAALDLEGEELDKILDSLV